MAQRFYKIGKFCATDTPGDILTFYASTTNDSRYDVFKSKAVNYIVPVGQILLAGNIHHSGAAVNCICYFTYGTTAISDAAGPPTGNTKISQPISNPTAYTPYIYDLVLVIPASNYPHIFSLATGATAVYFSCNGITI